ncbi:MAG: M1 family metallopeptidase [Caldilineaceae bacterium]|nr:M1 family metallopeptidase [Caldilineaceae bacterium]
MADLSVMNPPNARHPRSILLLLPLCWSLLLIGLLAACVGGNTTPVDPYALFRPAMPATAWPDDEMLKSMPRYDMTVELGSGLDVLTGTAYIHFTNTSQDPWTHVIFRLYPNLEQYGGLLSIQSAAVGGRAVPFSYQDQNTAVRVELPAALLTGKNTTVYLSWILDIPQWNDTPLAYRLLGNSQGMVSLPLAYPSLAVYQPGLTTGTGQWWLERGSVRGDAAFNYASLFAVTATLPNDQVPVTSGTLITSTLAGPNQSRHVWVTGPVREFLLHTSNRFQSESTTAYDTRITSYWLPDHEASGRAALQQTAAALRIYSDLFGPYGYSDLRVAPGPMGVRGMEYPQAFLLGVQLYDTYRTDLEIRTVHEVAHQWWYQLVHNDPVNTPWMDEGISEYASKLYYEAIRGRSYAENLQARRWQAVIDLLTARGADAPLNQPVAVYEDGTQYESVVYGKGALFYDAIRQALGERQFEAFLKSYQKNYRFQIVTPTDLLAELRAYDPQVADSLYQKWIGPLPDEKEPEGGE